MSRIDSAINIDDLKRMAKRRLPKIMFDFIEGGVEDEVGLRTNATRSAIAPGAAVLRRHREARAKGDTFRPDLCESVRHRADRHGRRLPQGRRTLLSQAAADADVPYLMSGASNASMEAGAKLAGKNLWYQIYGARDRKVAADLVKRAIDLGLTTLAVTCDVPVSSNRERNRRNGFVRPLRMTLPTILEAMLHPAWVD